MLKHLSYSTNTSQLRSDFYCTLDILEYAKRRQFIHAIEDLEGLIVQHLFELSKANLSLTGQLSFST